MADDDYGGNGYELYGCPRDSELRCELRRRKWRITWKLLGHITFHAAGDGCLFTMIDSWFRFVAASRWKCVCIVLTRFRSPFPVGFSAKTIEKALLM
jgi:hypothetical protein